MRIKMLATVTPFMGVPMPARALFYKNLPTAGDKALLFGKTYEAETNKNGAVFVRFLDGSTLGVMPGEFEIVK